MRFKCEEVNITENSDGTYKIELIDCEFKHANGEEVNAVITFPRVSEEGTNSFKNENTLPGSEIFQIVVPED